MITEEILEEIASYIYRLAPLIHPGGGSKLQCYAQILRELAASFPEFRAAANADAVTMEALRQEKQKLRQAVRDLTASSEKLRAVNQKTLQKALDQGQRIERQASAANNLKAENDSLKRQISAIQDSLSPFQIGPNGGLLIPRTSQLEQQIRELKAEVQQLEQMKTDQYQAAKELRAELETVRNQRNYYRDQEEDVRMQLDRLKADRGFTPQDQQRLRTAMHAIGEIIAGEQIEKVVIHPLTVGYQPDRRPSG